MDKFIEKHSNIQSENLMGRQDLQDWQNDLAINPLKLSPDFIHSLSLHMGVEFDSFSAQLDDCGDQIPRLENLVSENDFRLNLPRLERYDGIGNRIEKIIFHPSYIEVGDIIYGTGMMRYVNEAGSLLKALGLFFLTSHAGEAGHNCPVACTAGVIRVFNAIDNFDQKSAYMQNLLHPSFKENFTGAQFLTEVQGGSDVGKNAALALKQSDGTFRIKGEKWFCSNANADLILMTARYDKSQSGTRGLGLFLVPRHTYNGKLNGFTLRRLKEKLGTRTMASAEIDFNNAFAIHMGPVDEGFKLVMQNVLHLSRIYNTFSVCGSGRRALQIAGLYAKHRKAFGNPICNYPLVQENLANIQVENMALLASAIKLAADQDEIDLLQNPTPELLLKQRLMANLNKYISALWSVQHIHNCIDVLGGNGAIESFSSLPRLLRDSIVCENWEGTHNTLRMQVLRDILRYEQDEIFMNFMHGRLAKVSIQTIKIELENHLKSTQTLFGQLRQSNSRVQTYLIKEVLDMMSIGHLALCLLEEGQDMLETRHDDLKLVALDIFMDKHIRKTTPRDEEGLNKFATLISKFNYL